MAKKGIRPYGPGKYGKIIDGYAHDVALDGGIVETDWFENRQEALEEWAEIQEEFEEGDD